jgi:glycosyltransferase involved in cell wall biosynthesis
MKILLLHQYFLEENDSGGSRWNEMAKMWSEEGHDITVLGGMIHANGFGKHPDYKGKYFKKKQHGKVDVIRCHVSESYNSNFIGRLWGYFSFVSSSIWAGVFKAKGKFDVVVVTSPPLFIGVSGYILSRIKRAPYVFEIRDLWPESAIDTGVITNGAIIKVSYWLEKFIYKKAELINVLTPAFRDKLVDNKNINTEKIILVPNAADFSLSSKLVDSFDIKTFRTEHGFDGKFVIIYVGAHGVANHLDQVLDTGKLLVDTNVEFLLLGNGMEKARLVKRVEDEVICNVRFLDSVPKMDVFKYIMASDMGTSVLKKVDTFKTVYSNKTFDYMSCKKPILMAIDGVSKDLVEEAKAGVFVEPENPEYFAEKIRYYLENKQLLPIEGENGYMFAKANFDRKILAKKYIDCIQKLVNNG